MFALTLLSILATGVETINDRIDDPYPDMKATFEKANLAKIKDYPAATLLTGSTPLMRCKEAARANNSTDTKMSESFLGTIQAGGVQKLTPSLKRQNDQKLSEKDIITQISSLDGFQANEWKTFYNESNELQNAMKFKSMLSDYQFLTTYRILSGSLVVHTVITGGVYGISLAGDSYTVCNP